MKLLFACLWIKLVIDASWERVRSSNFSPEFNSGNPKLNSGRRPYSGMSTYMAFLAGPYQQIKSGVTFQTYSNITSSQSLVNSTVVTKIVFYFAKISFPWKIFPFVILSPGIPKWKLLQRHCINHQLFI